MSEPLEEELHIVDGFVDVECGERMLGLTICQDDQPPLDLYLAGDKDTPARTFIIALVKAANFFNKALGGPKATGVSLATIDNIN